jgi:hypothetical protein
MGHHFIPQRYLRNFEDAGRPGFIWLHDKQLRIARAAQIEHVAQTRHFYSEETEKILARHVEAPGNAVIKKLTEGSEISPVERVQLAYYIGVMLKRVPTRRRQSLEMIPGVLTDVVADVRQQLMSLASDLQADPELLARRLQEVDAAKKKFELQPPSEVLEQIREPWPTQGIIQALFDMTWRVLVSSGPQWFVSTDNPAFFFRAFGLANKQSELSFPLSTTHALHGSWYGAKGGLLFLRADQEIVKEINRRLASDAERLAFHHERAPWLLNILNKKNPYLSAIRWE